jgi:hypothetical protein
VSVLDPDTHSVDVTEAGPFGGFRVGEPQMGVSAPAPWVVGRDVGPGVLPRLDGVAERDRAVVDDRCRSDAVPAIAYLIR